MTTTNTKPNILIFMCDQLSSWGLSCYGGTEVHTPHIDRLANEGARCDQFFTNTALCTPSRACFMTGHYPQQSGIYHRGGTLADDQKCLAHYLNDAGYRTGYAGKWHLAGFRIDHSTNWQPQPDGGWTDIRHMWNCGHYKHIATSEDKGEHSGERHQMGDEHSYGSDWLADRACDFIQEHSQQAKTPTQTQPFAYMVSFPDPHQPYRAREPYASQFSPDDVVIPSSFAQEDVPDWLARDRETKDFPMKAENRKEWNRDREQTLRQVRSQYNAMTKNIDDCVGKVLASLEANGELDNTIIMFTTDHGDLMGEHGLTGKNFLYEPAYRTPMLIRWPQAIKAGTVVNDMINMIDVMPTLLDLVSIKADRDITGNSAASQLRGETVSDWDNRIFAHPFGYERVACFTPEWELGFDYHGEPILFDRINDPEQIHNRYHDPECAEIVSNIRQQMDEHYQQYCPRVSGWLPGQHGFDVPKPEFAKI